MRHLFTHSSIFHFRSFVTHFEKVFPGSVCWPSFDVQLKRTPSLKSTSCQFVSSSFLYVTRLSFQRLVSLVGVMHILVDRTLAPAFGHTFVLCGRRFCSPVSPRSTSFSMLHNGSLPSDSSCKIVLPPLFHKANPKPTCF